MKLFFSEKANGLMLRLILHSQFPIHVSRLKGVWGSMEQKTGVSLPTDRFRRKTPNFRDARDKVEKGRLGVLHKFVAKRFRFAMILATQRFDLIDQKLRTDNEPHQKNQGCTYQCLSRFSVPLILKPRNRGPPLL